MEDALDTIINKHKPILNVNPEMLAVLKNNNVAPLLCGRCSKPKGKTKLDCKCGHPTDYNKKIIINAKKYLASCVDVNEDKENGIRHKVNLPTIEGLALYLKASTPTMYTWEDEHVEFFYIMQELRQRQANALMSNGLSGAYNPTIAKVILTKHGYRDSQDITSDGKPIQGNSINFNVFREKLDETNS